MGIGTAGGGGLRKVGGGAPSRSIVCHASRSAASSGQCVLSRSNTSIALATLRPKRSGGERRLAQCLRAMESLRQFLNTTTTRTYAVGLSTSVLQDTVGDDLRQDRRVRRLP